MFGDVECSSGGRTKYNRNLLGLPKDHHYDALCVGTIPEEGYKNLTNGYYLRTKAMGRGCRFRGHTNSCGIITVKRTKGPKRYFGFQTGDIVSADVPKGKFAGHHVGRVLARKTGWFDIQLNDGSRATTNYKYCKLLQHDSGYLYAYKVG